jgi:small-conductance mechanosensitive channel
MPPKDAHSPHMTPPCHRGYLAAWLCVLVTAATLIAAPATTPAPGSADAVLQYLDRVIDWYRRVTALDASAATSQELLLRETVRANARHVVSLAFQFARAQADLIEADQRAAAAAAAAPATTAAVGTAAAVRARNLIQAQANAAARAAELEAQLRELDNELRAAPPASQPAVAARRDELQARLNLARAQADVLAEYTGFLTGAQAGGDIGLRRKIDDLERSLPEIGSDVLYPTTGPTGVAAVAAAPQASHPESAGMFELVGQLFTLSSRLAELSRVADQAADLAREAEQLRAPLRTEILDALRRGEALSTTRPTGDPAVLERRRQDLEQLTDRFRKLAAAGVPLGEQTVLLEAARQNILTWRSALAQEYAAVLRSLLLRLGVMVGVVAVIVVVSELWRRATFRYVHDARRRRQIMVVRRIAVTAVVLLVVAAGVVTEFGSLATFAGLITAGIAVALQTVILSGVAYFFFIGRFGVRPGDRVTVAGITGDVVEIGLFRLYLMELAGAPADPHPTGRVVVFSNAVLFQPSAFYKQLPGADYVWHEVKFTLSPDTDYALAEKRLLSAVESVFEEYRADVERQHAAVTRSLHVQMEPPRPQSRMRFVDAGLEFVVRYPVELKNASEVDDRITRRLLDAINEEPKLKLVPPTAPKLQPAT